jgi:hypothetical protein
MLGLIDDEEVATFGSPEAFRDRIDCINELERWAAYEELDGTVEHRWMLVLERLQKRGLTCSREADQFNNRVVVSQSGEQVLQNGRIPHVPGRQRLSPLFLQSECHLG